MFEKLLGPLLVAAGAMLWATDAPFRYPLIQKVDPIFVVFCEHAVGLLALSIWVFFRSRSELFKLKPSEWFLAALVGIGGSAFGLIFFTASFRYINPSIAILLQKLQPIFVVLIAYAALKERLPRRFFGWAAVAMIAAIVLSVPNFRPGALWDGILGTDPRSRGVIFAVAAAALWACSTVAGKVLVQRHTTGVVTFWRYAFGTLGLIALLIASPREVPAMGALLQASVAQAILYMSFVSGIFAMILYYLGLARTPASVTTFVELVYPVSAVMINTWVLKLPLEPLQIAAAMLLVFAVMRVSDSES